MDRFSQYKILGTPSSFVSESHKMILSIDTKNIGLHLWKCKKNTCMNSSMRLIVSMFGGENVPQHLYTNIQNWPTFHGEKKQCCCWWHSTSNPYYEDSLRSTIKLHGYIFLLLIILMAWRKQEIFELKEVYQLPSAADCRFRTLEVWDTRHAYTSWSYLRLL